MIARIACALHQLPRAVRREVTVREATALYARWEEWPPEGECAALMLSTQTTWKPRRKAQPFRESTPEELRAVMAELGAAPVLRKD